ncbi:hypothetical protein ABID70_000040 [Clavibacter michiganensis]
MKIPATKSPYCTQNGRSRPSSWRMESILSGVQVLPQMVTAGSGWSRKKIM